MNQEVINNVVEGHDPKKHARSFLYAFNGLKHILINEANFRIHLLVSLLVILLALFLKFNYMEWVVLVITIGFVMCMEIVNSMVEELTDHLVKEHHEGVRIVKDVGASFVLIAAFVSFIVGLLLFLPKLLAILNY
ncbi:hypothetical protein A2716_00085 [candidate division WWE3 bacterium RIFCSPHIGHO2_01_FULL_40_23]|nr:MAG: hypothetical protein A2716_00085 [candidate division WWE3 bacterium RIFCSPHIGHO2_01_FULL_40_23]